MDFDEYEYLEKTVEEQQEDKDSSKKKKSHGADKTERSCRKCDIDGEDRQGKRQRQRTRTLLRCSRRACRLCVNVKSSLFSTGGKVLEKNDQTPVTVADFGVQALISLDAFKSNRERCI